MNYRILQVLNMENTQQGLQTTFSLSANLANISSHSNDDIKMKYKLTEIGYKQISAANEEDIQLIANWYLSEWAIPIQRTIEKIKQLSMDNNEFQVLMTMANKPIATGGLYNQVRLLDKEPRFSIYKNWLALVYTKPEFREKGLGAMICNHIQDNAKNLGLKDIYLFTHTAESLYKRLGWQQLERLAFGGKDFVVMKKVL